MKNYLIIIFLFTLVACINNSNQSSNFKFRTENILLQQCDINFTSIENEYQFVRFLMNFSKKIDKDKIGIKVLYKKCIDTSPFENECGEFEIKNFKVINIKQLLILYSTKFDLDYYINDEGFVILGKNLKSY